MLTKNDLQAIGELISQQLKPINQDIQVIKATQQVQGKQLNRLEKRMDGFEKRMDGIERTMLTKDDLTVNNHLLETVFLVALGETRREIVRAMKLGFQEVVMHINLHAARIERLEEHSGLKPHKN